jgi:alcohol dehydrogenase (cytochrome c)
VNTLKHLATAAVFGAALLAVLCVVGPRAAGQSQQELNAAASSDDDWLITNKDYAGHRFVNLHQINKSNVTRLTPVCTYLSGVAAPSQSSPLVYKGIMYVTVGYLTAAIDASTCKEIWRHVWTPKEKELSNPNRGAAIKDGRLVRGTPDGNLIAIDSATGKLIWSQQITSPKENAYLSMPALIFEDLVIYGTAGADFGARNWLGAFKLSNGEEVWRFYSVPKEGEPGSETWSDPKVLPHGGGSYWTPVSLDKDKGIVFAAIGNPAPDFYGDIRTGGNLHTNSAVAIDVKTGNVLWTHQFTKHDVHDWDLTQTSPLITAEVRGKKRNIVIVSGKDGLQRAVDRDDHELLYEVPITTRTNVDTEPTLKGSYVCPGLLGGQEWSSAAYSPKLNTTFTPAVDWCGTAVKTPAPPDFIVGEHYRGGVINQDPAAKEKGWVTAMNVSTGEVRWKYHSDAPMLANITATAADLVFAGSLMGDFIALDASSGKVLYRHPMGATVAGGILSYRAHGKQFVAVETGGVSGFFGGTAPATFTLFALP